MIAPVPASRHWNPRLLPLAPHVLDALARGPIAPAAVDDEPWRDAAYAVDRDGAIHVSVLTPLPGVTPPQLDWWFAWHSADAARYRLWHPRAHVSARWADGRGTLGAGRAAYVGRTSIVDEYLGSERTSAAITFVAPHTLGVDEAALADEDVATAVCARMSLPGTPLEVGHMTHHVTRVPGGAEMRSRFWIGGRFATVRAAGPAGAALGAALRRVIRPRPTLARDLLVHCAEEMSHLATFLPALHAEEAPAAPAAPAQKDDVAPS